MGVIEAQFIRAGSPSVLTGLTKKQQTLIYEQRWNLNRPSLDEDLRPCVSWCWNSVLSGEALVLDYLRLVIKA